VLIIGAGPAGATAACVLARTGVTVVMIDTRSFPRDKVCGDGLIRDALNALSFVGVEEAVRREARYSNELRVYAPNGTHVALKGEFACLPRERFDHLLFNAATAAGAVFKQGTAIAPLLEGQRVAGARFKDGGAECSIVARYTILATGANATTLGSFGVRASAKPGAVAGRAYYVAPPELAAELAHLSIVYQRQWCPGYGWIFPGPQNRFNVGVGLFGSSAQEGGLHRFFADFVRTFPPAARLVGASTQVTEFRGAPIRSGLKQDDFGRPGLLAVGEAIAATYAATGEGIGKAMESGLLAAEVIRDALDGRRSPVGLEHAYRRRFRRRYLTRYQAYDLAQRWAARPAMLNLLAWRANRGRFVREELEALIAERGNAATLFSLPGLLKALVR
jgi:geranylgeranyl reductase family protein